MHPKKCFPPGADPSTEESRELVIQMKQGNEQALERLMELYTNRFATKAFSLLRDYVLVGEIVATAWIQIWNKIHGFKGDSSFSTWGYRIVQNACFSHLRRKIWTPYSTDAKLGEPGYVPKSSLAYRDSTSPSVFAEELLYSIESDIEQLPSIHFRVVYLHYFRGMTTAEIAEEIGCKQGTVLSRLHSARQKLKRLLCGRKIKNSNS